MLWRSNLPPTNLEQLYRRRCLEAWWQADFAALPGGCQEEIPGMMGLRAEHVEIEDIRFCIDHMYKRSNFSKCYPPYGALSELALSEIN